MLHSVYSIEGKQFMTSKVHQLLHFAKSVRSLGPLWAHSCFPFEDMNGKLKRMFHGTRTPHLQVCFKCMHASKSHIKLYYISNY